MDYSPSIRSKHCKLHIRQLCFKIYFNRFALKLNTFMKDLNRIKVVLAEKKVTGKWLADKIGRSSCTVSKWCTNSAQPDLQTLNRIASILEVNMRDLLTDNVE